jgi:hypothetical protein
LGDRLTEEMDPLEDSRRRLRRNRRTSSECGSLVRCLRRPLPPSERATTMHGYGTRNGRRGDWAGVPTTARVTQSQPLAAVRGRARTGSSSCARGASLDLQTIARVRSTSLTAELRRASEGQEARDPCGRCVPSGQASQCCTDWADGFICGRLRRRSALRPVSRSCILVATTRTVGTERVSATGSPKKWIRWKTRGDDNAGIGTLAPSVDL